MPSQYLPPISLISFYFPYHCLRISWVKAHVGICGNELVDQLAKAATRNSNIAVSFNTIPTSTFYSELKEAAIQKWQTDWDKCTKAAITKEFFPNTG